MPMGYVIPYEISSKINVTYTYIRVFNISSFVSFDHVDTKEMIKYQTINQ